MGSQVFQSLQKYLRRCHMPLYILIFLVECDCMSEEALKVVQDNGHYYLTEEGLYLRMFGGLIGSFPSI